MAGSTRLGSAPWAGGNLARSSNRRSLAAAASLSARSNRPGFWARLTKFGAAIARAPGRFKPVVGGDKARLVAKPVRITRTAMPTPHATTLVRAALRPDASKKMGWLAIGF